MHTFFSKITVSFELPLLLTLGRMETVPHTSRLKGQMVVQLKLGVL